MTAQLNPFHPFSWRIAMRRNLSRFIAASAALVLTAGTANAAVVTDFSSFSSATSNLLTSPNTRTQAFTTTTGVGTNSVIATATGGTGAGQAVYLSDNFSLTTVGSRISASLGSLAGTAHGSQGIGLAVASSDAITSRQNLVLFFFRNNAGQEVGFSTINDAGTGPAASVINFGGAALAYPDSIFIERTATGYKLGSITGVTETIHYTPTIGLGDVTANGTAVGIYSDVRNSNNVNTLTNFSHVVPEPGSLALVGFGGLLIGSRRRRK